MEVETLASCCLCRSDRLEWFDADCHICQCRSCGYVFHNPRPVFRRIVEFYSTPDKYDSWLAEEQARDRIWKKRLKKLGRTKKPGTLLDIGTGIGQFLHHAKRYYTQVYGTEISDPAISIARSKYNLNLIEGDILDIRLGETSSFDNVTLFHVLEHVPDPRRLIETCRSLLADDGVLVVAVPNEILSLRTRWMKLRMRIRLLLGMGMEGYRQAHIGLSGLRKITLEDPAFEVHLSHFTPRVLKHLLVSSGFSIVEESLDPVNVASGWRYVVHQSYYIFSACLMSVLGINLYETIWISARKQA